MADILVGTRKGFFKYAKSAGGWEIVSRHFLGDSINLLMKDPRDGVLYGVLDSEHFGTKLHKSPDDGVTWKEITTPKYPDLPEEPPSFS